MIQAKQQKPFISAIMEERKTQINNLHLPLSNAAFSCLLGGPHRCCSTWLHSHLCRTSLLARHLPRQLLFLRTRKNKWLPCWIPFLFINKESCLAAAAISISQPVARQVGTHPNNFQCVECGIPRRKEMATPIHWHSHSPNAVSCCESDDERLEDWLWVSWFQESSRKFYGAAGVVIKPNNNEKWITTK